MRTIRIGTRDSKLAMAQAGLLQRAIEAYDSDIRAVLVSMKTTGDKILDQTLEKVGGKGLFVKELDRALLDGEVDIAVHSCKDLPMVLEPGLPLVAASRREDVRDCLVLPASRGGDDALGDAVFQGNAAWDMSEPVGCSSARRRLQLQGMYPAARVEPVRGNVITRLRKLDEGQYSALLLAAAGLNRLGLQARISRPYSPHEMLPSAGQGILAVQAREGEGTDYLAAFRDEGSMLCALAERAFVRALDGGCTKPCAAYARLDGGRLFIRGMYVSDDESITRYGSIACQPQQGEEQAARLAERLRDGQER